MILEAYPDIINPTEECISQVKTAGEPAVPLEDGIEHDSLGYGAINGERWLNKIQSSVAC